MKRLIAYVSGNVQRVGYRARVIDIAGAARLKGTITNLKDGRVKIIAEGDDETLEWFEKAIDIKNTLIHVSSLDKEYSPATGEFDDFGKVVGKGETDSRLDTAAVLLKEIIDSVNKMSDNLSGKIDQMNENLGGKIDHLSGKSDRIADGQDELLVEVKDMNRSLNDKIDRVLEKSDIEDLKTDMSEIKSALRAKGII